MQGRRLQGLAQAYHSSGGAGGFVQRALLVAEGTLHPGHVTTELRRLREGHRGRGVLGTYEAVARVAWDQPGRGGAVSGSASRFFSSLTLLSQYSHFHAVTFHAVTFLLSLFTLSFCPSESMCALRPCAAMHWDVERRHPYARVELDTARHSPVFITEHLWALMGARLAY